MESLRECSLCGAEHDDLDGGQFCEKCTNRLANLLHQFLKFPKKQAENLAWLLSTIDYKMRWAQGEIVSHKDQIDELTLDFERHIHSQGKVLTPYQRRTIIPRRL